MISSLKNPLLKEVRRALARGTLTGDGYAVAETFHLLEEALRSGCQVSTVLAAESVLSTVEQHIGELPDARLLVLPGSTMEQLATTESSQGVIALVKPPEWTLDQVLGGQSLVVMLDGIQDPGNAGTILRAAEAFGATGALLLKGTVNPFNSKTLRASAGSTFRLPMAYGVDAYIACAAMAQKRLEVFAAVPRAGIALPQVDFTKPCAIIIGSEGRGVSEKLRGAALGFSVPTVGVESLNAAMAASVILYEASRQRRAATP